MKYSDFKICDLDFDFIQEIAKTYNIDYNEAPIYNNITNDVIYYILYEAVNNLNIKDNTKDILINSIYTNCIDSGYNINLENYKNELTKKDYKIIEKFLDL